MTTTSLRLICLIKTASYMITIGNGVGKAILIYIRLKLMV